MGSFRLITCLATALMVSVKIYSQCIHVQLLSQADVNAFNCTEILRSLTISGSDITDLSPLSNITAIGQPLSLEDSRQENIPETANITSGLLVTGNDMLVNLDGLDNVGIVYGDVQIFSNPLLMGIDGLSSLHTVTGDIAIFGNDVLTDVDGLGSLTGNINKLTITNNSTLSDCSGLVDVFISADIGEVIMNGNAGNCNNNGADAYPVPTISQWGLIILGLCLSIFGFVAINQKSITTPISTDHFEN